MRRGFTLLEMLITIVVLTVGITSVLRMMSIAIFTDTNTENAAIAYYLAQEFMEDAKDADAYADIVALSRANLDDDLGSEYDNYGDFDREVTVSGDPKQVNVIVYWSVKGDEQSINLVSIFADYDY